MQCPKCQSSTKVNQTRPSENCDKRWRSCLNCAFVFTTLERVCVDVGEPFGVCEVSPEQPEKSFKRKVKALTPEKFVAFPNHIALKGLSKEVRPLVCKWWNESRWLKQKSKAVWSVDAFTMSVQRLYGLPNYLQEELAKAGIEHGWQALKLSYINQALEATPNAEGGLAPKDSAMNEAVRQWENKAS
tara:strand:- start:538 stop:1098 length:561 start_codon:yes stop_codon:yes gene_type:complete